MLVFSKILHLMPTNKSLGINGLTIELYHIFWDILHPHLAIIWTESLEELPMLCKLGLLPKRGDLCNLRNWCPVLLLNGLQGHSKGHVWLKSVVADVIHPGQTIFNYIFLLGELLHLVCRNDLSLTLLSLIQEKAVNRVDHGFLMGTLQAFSSSSCFVEFLQVLYPFVEYLVKLNWALTEPITFGDGVHQGGLLSSQLCTVTIEPFLPLVL